MSTGVHSGSPGGAWPEGRSPEILGQLGWACTSLQFGISCFLVVYDTDQDSLQNERFFLSERLPQNCNLDANCHYF